jgi:hypothetical protein
MSYQKKKMKKSFFSQTKYRLGLAKIALLKFTGKVAAKADERRKPMFAMSRALESLRKYDRLETNPDISLLEGSVTSQLEENGLLRLCVFACPKFNPKALFSSKPEGYMPTEAGPDLFEPRIQKILSLRQALMQTGLPTEINVVIGDNDAEGYLFPFMNSLRIDEDIYKWRQSEYCLSFKKRCRNIFGASRCVVWSLAEMGVSRDDKEPIIAGAALKKEVNFFKWLFSLDGPYRGRLNFSEKALANMAFLKYQLYGAQGRFLETLGGVLLQTEGPGVWLERTNMLRSTGANAIPAIYPWIRKDEAQ